MTGPVPHLPVLRVAPLDRLLRHEEIDPFRVDRLMERISSEGLQVNPMICCEAPGGELTLLDGATRSESLRRMGLRHAVIQLVDRSAVRLETWHHVVRECEPEDLFAVLSDTPGLARDEGTPRLHLRDGREFRVTSASNRDLSTLVHRYVGRWTVNRVTEPSTGLVTTRFPDWAALVEFRRLTIDEVMAAAVGDDLLPAGITRFLVRDRALRVNVPLDLLRSPGAVEAKQSALDDLIADRARAGRVRRYEEPVFILDD